MRRVYYSEKNGVPAVTRKSAISIFNHEFVYLKILKVLDIPDMQHQEMFFKANKLNIFHIRGVRFVPPILVRDH